MNTDIVVRNSSELPAVCSKIELMLEKAQTPQELQQVAAIASAAVTYAAKFAKDQRDEISKLRAVKLEAERRLGQILQKMPKNKGGLLRGNTVLPRGNDARLEDFGLTKMQSSRMQALAKLPDEEWEKVKTGERPIPRPAKHRSKKETRKEIVLQELKEAYNRTPLETALFSCIAILASEKELTGKAVELARTLRDQLNRYLNTTSCELVN